MRYRFETFGGIIASEAPPFLAYVDRPFMRQLGLGESSLWGPAEGHSSCLSAPTEVHLAATRACPGQCRHCYVDGGEPAAREMDTPTFKRALTVLAEMNVFHVALGGGEALLRPDLFELADHARMLGLVPNLTISGATLTPELAPRLRVFGQVNVSLDGVDHDGTSSVFREGRMMRERAERAIELLLCAGVTTGINCVVGRHNFHALEALFAYAVAQGVNEIEFLRLKPVGRGRGGYQAARTTHEQNIALTPLLAQLSAASGLRAKIDCSFVPMLCYHRPSLELLQKTATYGCEAGNVLLGVDSEGTVAGCSFLPGSARTIFNLPRVWRTDPALEVMRTWTRRAPAPCDRCEYLAVCKGGCHAVAAFVVDDLQAPDPDCPRVVEWRGGPSR